MTTSRRFSAIAIALLGCTIACVAALACLPRFAPFTRPSPAQGRPDIVELLDRIPSRLPMMRTINALPRAIGGGSWQSIGPNGILEGQQGTPAPSPSSSHVSLLGTGQTAATGRIKSVATHPTDVNTIYVGAEMGGVWKTTDGGITWRALTDNQCSLRTNTVVIDRVNPNIVYAGTNDCGVLRSTDAGDSWTTFQVGSTPLRVAALAIDPLTSGSSSGTVIYAATSRGVFRSNNSGQSFTSVLQSTVPDAMSIVDIVVDPVNSLNIYALAATRVSVSYAITVQKSVNGGVTWTSSNTLALTQIAGRHLAIAPSDPRVLYVSIANSDNTIVAIFRSGNSGQTWTVTNGQPDLGRYGDNGGEDAIAVDLADANVVFHGGLALNKSTDGGGTWRTIGAGVHVDHHAFQFDKAGVLYVSNDGGLWRSADKGTTWLPRNGNLAVSQFYPKMGIASDFSVIYGGNQDNGMSAYTGSTNWRKVAGGDGGSAVVDPNDPRVVYFTLVSIPGVVRCDTSNQCSALTQGLNLNQSGDHLPPLGGSGSGSNFVMYLGYSSVYRSSDRGLTWTATNGGPTLTRAMAVSPSNSNVLMATDFFTLWTSRNGGASWSKVTGLPAGLMYSLTFDPDDDRVAYVGYGDLSATINPVWRTTDGGATWQDLKAPLILTLTVATGITQGVKTLFMGTPAGVIRSLNNGATWENFSSGLPNVWISDLAYNASAGVLVAATYGRGMFAISLK